MNAYSGIVKTPDEENGRETDRCESYPWKSGGVSAECNRSRLEECKVSLRTEVWRPVALVMLPVGMAMCGEGLLLRPCTMPGTDWAPAITQGTREPSREDGE
jgi:hypothetical protein